MFWRHKRKLSSKYFYHSLGEAWYGYMTVHYSDCWLFCPLVSRDAFCSYQAATAARPRFPNCDFQDLRGLDCKEHRCKTAVEACFIKRSALLTPAASNKHTHPDVWRGRCAGPLPESGLFLHLSCHDRTAETRKVRGSKESCLCQPLIDTDN